LILVNVSRGDGLRLGILQDGRVIDVEGSAARIGIEAPATFQELITCMRQGLGKLESLAAVVPDDEKQPVDALDIGPAVPSPGKIICIGLNYRHHAAESGMDIPDEPILFSKFGNAIAASGQDIAIDGMSQVDYEAELGVVIGQKARNVSAEDALSHVLGYCNANDVSDRERQFRSSQWLLGKTADGFCPVGPWLRTADTGFDAQNLAIRGWLNGDLRQKSNTSDMIFSIPELIAYISRQFTLEPGDLLLTGTPMGVILGRERKEWIQAGDEYRVEIDGLGSLVNRFTTGS
jgi:2-keto-4-pentenoate hydratase/2-oxohepta-3-ene-1,7-dioic acid hydratase in catechol pathway